MQAPKRPRREEPNEEPASSDAPRSAIRPHGPGEDTAFMEEILRELSAQNEQARSRAAHTRLGRGLRSDPPSAAPTERPAVVHVARDGAFRTDEGTANARAYLPAKTLAPKPAALIEKATVKVSDPRRIPTVRVPRKRTERASPADLGADESVPTLRSGAKASSPEPAEAPLSPRAQRRWLGLVLAIGVILLVLAIMVVARGRW